MRLGIELFGGVRATIDGVPLQIAGRRSQALLAALTLADRQVVSTDRLIDCVWDDAPPRTARRTLQSYVAALRRVLGGDTGPLSASGAGYVLTVDRPNIDLFDFADSVARAKPASAEDPARAAVDLSRALRSWRVPLDGLRPSLSLQAMVAPYEELRLGALEALNDVELDFGDPGRAVGRLETLVREHPVRERFWAQLAGGLARLGRRDAALQACQRARESLREQLGVNPSPLLQRLERHILDGEPWPRPADTTAPYATTAAAIGNPPCASRVSLPRPMTGRDGRDMVASPAGTVTFLLSDVEGSTRRWQEAPEAMAVAVPRHYELLDQAIVAHGGVRPLEQGEGDSVVGAFSNASDAMAAAIDAQQAFSLERWPEGADLRVRIALHTGEAQQRDQGKYAGHTLNRGARIRDSGHGSQVLVSSTTAALLADRLPADTTLFDLGQHRLKDLQRPEQIWQLIHPDLPTTFPPLRSLDVVRQNLPVQLTPLIGRTSEIADVRRLLGRDRLVTLTGSAGVGKTRLALAVSADAIDLHPGGVWWVELAPLSDPEAVGRAALAAVGAREASGATATDQLAIELGDQPSLLVLDNCEHLTVTLAALVAGLLAANPSISVLATSREPLGVPGEITYRVPSLPCPTPGQAIDLPTLSRFDAVALFVERACRARPAFAINDVNAAAVTQICQRLDGIPLAIELAAARCRQLSTQRIVTELDHRFRLLTGGARTLLARQQTLAASVDWSHERLDDAEQATFRRLSVFSGPFPLEAAEAVAAFSGDVDPTDVLDLISRLIDKSLVVADEGVSGQPRYRMLETLRAYAFDRAQTAGELTKMREAHAAWWTDWLEPRAAMPTDADLEEVEEYSENLIAALNWSSDRPPLGLRLLRGMARAWESLGRAGDVIAAADRLLTDDNAHQYGAEWLSAAISSDGLYWLARGRDAHWAHIARIECVAAQHGDDYHLSLARWNPVVEHEAPEGANLAVPDMARDRGDVFLEAQLITVLAYLTGEDEPAAAPPLLLRARQLATASGSRYLRDRASQAQAAAAAAVGDLATSIELATGILQRKSSATWADLVRLLSFSALLACDAAALRLAVEVGDRAVRMSPGPAPWVHDARHRLHLHEGQRSVVDAGLCGPGASTAPVSPGTLWLMGREALDAGAEDDVLYHVRALARNVPHSRAVLATIEGAARADEGRLHDALTIAIDQGLRLIAADALEGLALTAATVERWTESLRLLGSAQRLRDETGYQWRFPFEQRSVDAARNAAVAALGGDAEAAVAAGRSLAWQAAAEDALRT